MLKMIRPICGVPIGLLDEVFWRRKVGSRFSNNTMKEVMSV